MKTQILFLSIVATSAYAQVNPYDRCSDQRNQMMRFQEPASSACDEGIKYAKKCCANGENSCFAQGDAVEASGGINGAAKTNLSGEKSLQGGLGKNLKFCYDSQERYVQQKCTSPSDKKVADHYKTANTAVTDCLSKEIEKSLKRMGPEAASENPASDRDPASEQDIVNALTPKH